MSIGRWEEVKAKLPMIAAWCRDGLIEEQIAHNLGIGHSTLSKYKVEHVELMETLKRNKEIVDVQVENSLFKRANGFRYTEVTKEMAVVMDEDGEPKKHRNGKLVYALQVTKEVIKEVNPDTTAQIFWLKNRKPKEWSDRKDFKVESQVNNSNKIDLTGYSTEQLKEMLK